jgi:hypothetical protein
MAMARTDVDSGAAKVLAAAKAGDLDTARSYLGVSMVDALGEIDPDSEMAYNRVLVQCGYVLICCMQEIRDQRRELEPGSYPDLAPGARYTLSTLDNSDGYALGDMSLDRVQLASARMFEAYLNDDYHGFLTVLRDTDMDVSTQEPILRSILWAVASQALALRLETQLALPSYVAKAG